MSNVPSTAAILGVVLHLASCATYVVEEVGSSLGPGDPPGFTRATSINQPGEVVGYTVRSNRVSSFGGGHSFIFDAEDTYAEGLTDAAGRFGFYPVTGGRLILTVSGGMVISDLLRGHAVVVTDNAATLPQPSEELGTLPGGRFSGGKDINDRAQVTGWSEKTCLDERCFVRAFLWTHADGMQDLGTLGGDNSQGEAINARGQIAGGSDVLVEGSTGTFRAFRYTPGIGMVNLGTLSGGDWSIAYGINDQGHVVGESSTQSVFQGLAFGPLVGFDFPPYRAFLWKEGEGMQSLGSLGGGSAATAINNQDVVVGYSGLTGDRASPHGGHAFRWTAEEGMIDLNDLLPFWSGWELLNAFDINDKGQIVGSGRIDGQIRGYRLSPPRIEGGVS